MIEIRVSNRLYGRIWNAKLNMEEKQMRNIKMTQFVTCMLESYLIHTGEKGL